MTPSPRPRLGGRTAQPRGRCQGRALFLRGPRAPRGVFGCTHTTAPLRAVGAASGERPQQRLLGSGGGGVGGGAEFGSRSQQKHPRGEGGARWRSCRAWPSKKKTKKTTPRWQKNAVWAWWPRPRPALGLGWAPGPAAAPGTATRPRPQSRVWDGADAHPVLRATPQTPWGGSDPTKPCGGSRATLPPSPARGSAHHQALADGCRSGGPGGRAPLPTPKKRSRSRSQDVST